MERFENIILMDTTEIISIVRRALSKIDPRLVEHGERVAYLARKICEASGDRAAFDLSALYILCVLHDIGAYKTDEIDNMVRFETEVPFEHSLYGYLFLKNTPPVAEYAEALLYHHADFAVTEAAAGAYARYAELIHLADRVDVLLNLADRDLSVLRARAGTVFNPEYVEAFFRAEARGGLTEALRSGSYRDEVRAVEAGLAIPGGAILDYLKLLVYAIDFRSPYTVTHTADTTIISVETGKLLGLDDRTLQTLYVGAFLHDIGKIAIPHDVLEKPARLTREEFELVKRHIPEGEHILRGVVSDEICDIAMRHHEKLDGSGYSHGLTAPQLTIPQRIVAVSDILSALSQRRSYKEPFPKDQVLRILREMRDAGQLCPRVVDAVCGHYDLILRNVERSHDPVKMLYSDLLREYAARRADLVRLHR